MTARITIVLVRPKEDGNVGAVARLAKNFGAERLVLVTPRAPLEQDARRRAMAGVSFLKGAKIFGDLFEAVKDSDFVVGTTDLSYGRSTAFLRRSIPPERLAELIRPVEGRLALVFGPEDNGLGRDELARCDLLVHIPARREFPTLNLSHAVGVMLYSIHRGKGSDDPESTPAPDLIELNGPERELFLRRLNELMGKVGYPRHKRKGLELLFRRVLGRSTPAEAELRMMLGLLRSIDRSLKNAHDRKR